jgi:hypothetical protein
MRPLTKTALAGGGVLLAGWIGWGLYSSRTTESVPYERIRTIDSLELRKYPRTIRVETTSSDRRTAFRRLFRYISGANRGDASISMTAPVETEDGDSVSMTSPVRTDSDTSGAQEVRMSFYLPAEYDPDSAPQPTDPEVRLVTEPPKTVAVDRFSWYAPEWRVERRTQHLLDTIQSEGIEPAGTRSLLRYNDPWTPPFLRRNEVAVPVAETD